MSDSHEGAEKDSEEGAKSFSLRRNRFDKVGFKSLTALSAKDSLENLQKLRKRNDAGPRRIFFGRSSNGADKRTKKKFKKRFDKQNVSEVNIRRATEEDDSEKLVSIVGPRNFVKQPAPTDKETILDDSKSSEPTTTERTEEILHSFENLKLEPDDEVKSPMDCGFGDARPKDLSLQLDVGNDSLTDMACAQRRSVQWNREVDVIYYTGNSSGGKGKVVRRENEPLREEADQQARRQRFIQLALTKSLLSDVGVCQLRDPWLAAAAAAAAVLPK